jgi:hypothetical protein
MNGMEEEKEQLPADGVTGFFLTLFSLISPISATCHQEVLKIQERYQFLHCFFFACHLFYFPTYHVSICKYFVFAVLFSRLARFA